jgi:peptidoglycan/LPS O-acetylase OafA/YrhL
MRLDAFLWACLVAIAIYERGRIWKIIARRGFHMCVLGALAAIYAIALVHPMQLTKLALQSALMPLVVVPTVFLPGYWISRMLEWAPLRWLGRISYGVYLWQQLFFPPTGASMVTDAEWFPLKVAVLLSLTAASYQWIERPLIDYGRRRAGLLGMVSPQLKSDAPREHVEKGGR